MGRTGGENPQPQLPGLTDADLARWPVWDFAYTSSVDVVGVEPVTLFRVSDVGPDALPPREARRALLIALRRLAARKSMRLRETAFTVFWLAEDAGGVLGLGTMPHRCLESIQRRLERIGAVPAGEGSSEGMAPLWRYDHRHVIEYGDLEDAGTTYVDGRARSNTEMTIWRRTAVTAEEADLPPRYGKLRR